MNEKTVEALPLGTPNEDVIFRLKEALELAERGELRSVTIAGVMTGNEAFTAYSTSNIFLSIAMMETLKVQLLQAVLSQP